MKILNKKFMVMMISGVILIVLSSITFKSFGKSEPNLHQEEVLEDKNQITRNLQVEKVSEKIQSDVDEAFIVYLIKTYSKTREQLLQLQRDMGSWQNVAQKLYQDQMNEKKLTHQEIIDLYNQGYGLQDIQKAQELALYSDKTVNEVLFVKGKTTKENDKTWDEVANILQIDTRSPEEELGISKNQLEKMRKEGLSPEQTMQIAGLSYNYRKDYNEILSDVKNGKKIEELEAIYKNEWETSSEFLEEKQKQKEKQDVNRETWLKENFNITNEQILLCKAYGVTGYEIRIAVNAAEKNNIQLEALLKAKKNSLNWIDAVSKVNGGEKK